MKKAKETFGKTAERACKLTATGKALKHSSQRKPLTSPRPLMLRFHREDPDLHYWLHEVVCTTSEQPHMRTVQPSWALGCTKKSSTNINSNRNWFVYSKIRILIVEAK